MGRWAQARRRGSVKSGFPLPAPTGTDWILRGVAGFPDYPEVQLLTAFPSGAQWVVTYYRPGYGGTVTQDATGNITYAPLGHGETVNAWTYWCTPAGARLSPDSAPQTYNYP